MASSKKSSPSSRRAWVEMLQLTLRNEVTAVALLAEGVGRNRRLARKDRSAGVALLAEGVGRNISSTVS